jgi:hypothetical protein
VRDLTPIANFRMRVEAELAARVLDGAHIPYVVESTESMQLGPVGAGTTIFVRPQDVGTARRLLDEPDPAGQASPDE